LLDNEACHVRHVPVNRSVIEKALLKTRHQNV
jgi:hypothetical protein